MLEDKHLLIFSSCSITTVRNSLRQIRSCNILLLQFAHKLLSQKVPVSLKTLSYASQEYGNDPNSKKREGYHQNVDLPIMLTKKKKKPYPIPLKQIKRSAKADKELAQRGIEKPLEPGKNGLLVTHLIPVAHEVLDAWKILIKGLSHLLHVIPVYACRLIFSGQEISL